MAFERQARDDRKACRTAAAKGKVAIKGDGHQIVGIRVDGPCWRRSVLSTYDVWKRVHAHVHASTRVCRCVCVYVRAGACACVPVRIRA